MMRGLLVVAAIAGAAAFPAAASAENTPLGAATITLGRTLPVICPTIYLPNVTVAWKVVVGEGGAGGTVRPVVEGVVGDPVELPATPGTYTFPAPHILSGSACRELAGIVQTTGGHAIVTREDTTATYLDVRREGQADERIDGARLTTSLVTEPDVDGDRLGDRTEERPDLRVTVAPAREADGRLRVPVTVTNAGATSADLPELEARSLPGAHWEGDCSPVFHYPTCVTPRLAPGESRTLVLRADAPAAGTLSVTAKSEGTDIAPADNTATAAYAAAAPFDLAAAAKQRLSRGVKVQVRAVRAGRTRVTLAVKVRGRTVKLGKIVTLAPYTPRTVTLRATGAKLRSLRRAVARAPLTGEITVRTINGKTPVTATNTVRR